MLSGGGFSWGLSFAFLFFLFSKKKKKEKKDAKCHLSIAFCSAPRSIAMLVQTPAGDSLFRQKGGFPLAEIVWS
eukprot:m.155342 g.155342  ORF g.155342 m.155342 type:complete len:74 (-) comp20807_c1_seq7:7167-7388(-)